MTRSSLSGREGALRRNICLLLEYDGRPFHGWQVQPVSPTVQEVLSEAIDRITGEPSVPKGSGRTDAGVHALGQVANFFTGSSLPADTFLRAINSLAGPSIAVLSAIEVPETFDAQYGAVSKTYRYRLLLRPSPSPMEYGRSWHIPGPLNLHRVRKAAEHFVGERDFAAFRSAGCASRNSVRTISALTIRRSGEKVEIDITANGFLRQMVRNIVGTLVDAGRGRIPPRTVPAILSSGDRSLAGVAAPPQGLYLLTVDYPPPFRWP